MLLQSKYKFFEYESFFWFFCITTNVFGLGMSWGFGRQKFKLMMNWQV